MDRVEPMVAMEPILVLILSILQVSTIGIISQFYGKDYHNFLCDESSDTQYHFYIGKQISHEFGYPYANSQPKLYCQNKPYWNPGAKIDQAIVDYKCSDTKIMQLIYAYGSAVIGIYAGDHGFDNYVPGAGHGVFDTCRYNFVF